MAMAEREVPTFGKRSCAPRQRDDIPSSFQHVEAIGKTIGKLGALGEESRLIVIASDAGQGMAQRRLDDTTGRVGQIEVDRAPQARAPVD